MSRKPVKADLSQEDLVLLIESLKVWRQAIVSQTGILFLSGNQRNSLDELRLDVEVLTERLDRLLRGT